MPTSAFCSYILIVGAGPAKNCTEKRAHGALIMQGGPGTFQSHHID